MSGHTSPHADDLEFVRRIASGETEAEEQFFAKYRPRFMRIAYRRRIRAQDCQDIAQDALLKAIRQMRQVQFKGESSLGTWLERIISGAIADYYRKVKKEPLQKLTTDGEPIPLDSLPATLTDGIEDGVMIREAMLGLPSDAKLILLLKHTEGCTLQEIATMLGITIGQAGSKLYGAHQKFRDQLEAVGEKRKNGRKKLPHNAGINSLEGE